MKCDNAQLMISKDVEGALPIDDRVLLYAHIDTCAACAAYRRDTAALQSKLVSSLHENVDSIDLVCSIMAEINVNRARPRRRLVWALVPGLCAAVLMFALLVRPHIKPESVPPTRQAVVKHEKVRKETVAVKEQYEKPAVVQNPVKIATSNVVVSKNNIGHAHSDVQREIPVPVEEQSEPVEVDEPVELPEDNTVTASDTSSGMIPNTLVVVMPEPVRHESIRVASSDVGLCFVSEPPYRTTADVCVNVPVVTGIEQVKVYEIPIQMPSRRVVLASNPYEELYR